MSITAYQTIEHKTIQILKEKVVYNNLTPQDLELKLVDLEKGNFEINVNLEFNEKLNFGFPRHAGGIISLNATTKDGALQEYKNKLNQIERGDYKLNIYSDGSVDIKFGE